ncbi:MAG: DUF2207 domain-containing protein, partial [Candidatus Saccharimonadales bacterium]
MWRIFRLITPKSLLAGLVLGSVLVAFAGQALADTNDFVINDFSANYQLRNDDKQGTMTVTEDITVTFTDNNHGLLRAVPNTYKANSLRLNINYAESDSGAPAQFTTYQENDNTVIKIGDPNRTVTGRQHYRINYEVSNIISFYDDHDEFYWDINGDQWGQPAERVSASITLSEGLATNGQLACFAGSFGGTGQKCTIQQEGSVITASAAGLDAGQTLTVVTGFDKGYFSPSTSGDWLRDHMQAFLGIILPPLLAGGYALRRWLRFGRDPKGRGTIVPQFEAPQNLRPAEVGTLQD